MPSARVLLLTVLALATVTAGCFGGGETLSRQSARERASLADAMLASPPGADVVPTGNTVEFDLFVHRMMHEVYPGASMVMWGFGTSEDPSTASVPGPVLRVTEGDLVVVNLHATFGGFNHTIHWHGQHVPWEMDGVPYVSQAPAEPGEVFTYTFMAKPAGTYWYHCHVDAVHHIDMGMYGVLIVDPQDPAEDPRYDREAILVLDDMDRFHVEAGQPTNPQSLPQDGDPNSYEAFLRRQASDSVARNPAAHEHATKTPLRPERNWYPVTYAPYTATYNTFLINGVAFPYTMPLSGETGEVLRLRFINAGNSLFAMHLHGHHVLVTHKDGVLLPSPYWADTLALVPGERLDAYVRLDNPGLWELHDHVGGHTQNDNVFPGGAMTMLCYGVDACAGRGGHEHGGGRPYRSGDFIGWTAGVLP